MTIKKWLVTMINEDHETDTLTVEATNCHHARLDAEELYNRPGYHAYSVKPYQEKE